MVDVRKWIWNILISIDQLGNTLAGGDPDETISSRSGKAKRDGKLWGRLMCRFLNVFDPGHCEGAIESDEGKDEL